MDTALVESFYVSGKRWIIVAKICCLTIKRTPGEKIDPVRNFCNYLPNEGIQFPKNHTA